MKKLPTILISTLIISAIAPALNSAKTYALYIDENNVSWYTVPELLEYKKIIDAEENSLCGSNESCLKNYRDSKVLTDEKYAALSILQYWQFIVTSIKPEAKTVKLLLFDEDMNSRRIGRPARRNVQVSDILIAWFKDQPAHEEFYRLTQYKKILPQEYSPDIHLILEFHGDDTATIERDREVEYEIDTDISNNTRGSYTYRIGTNYFNKSATIDYDTCLRAEGYPNGDCRLMVTTNGISYMFFKDPEEEAENPNSQEDTIEDLPEASDTNQDNIEDSTEDTSKQQSTIFPKSPDTGSFTSPCATKTIEFPWWLVGLIALGDAAVLWLFWPKPKNRNSKKSRS